MVYKIKGKYNSMQSAPTNIYEELSIEELDLEIKKLEEKS